MADAVAFQGNANKKACTLLRRQQRHHTRRSYQALKAKLLAVLQPMPDAISIETWKTLGNPCLSAAPSCFSVSWCGVSQPCEQPSLCGGSQAQQCLQLTQEGEAAPAFEHLREGTRIQAARASVWHSQEPDPPNSLESKVVPSSAKVAYLKYNLVRVLEAAPSEVVASGEEAQTPSSKVAATSEVVPSGVEAVAGVFSSGWWYSKLQAAQPALGVAEQPAPAQPPSSLAEESQPEPHTSHSEAAAVAPVSAKEAAESTTVAMLPRLQFLEVADAGALVSCSWQHLTVDSCYPPERPWLSQASLPVHNKLLLQSVRCGRRVKKPPFLL